MIRVKFLRGIKDCTLISLSLGGARLLWCSSLKLGQVWGQVLILGSSRVRFQVGSRVGFSLSQELVLESRVDFDWIWTKCC